ncbi:SPOR domain-containing protein [Gordonia sp. PDNC005]|jgi:cell division septation protein DedD|uniref:SPOR domain-containing protein n=1 Tax=unclassified Gordonia (in: high G+C Gram-positive bacteria) TaxID=2657482 RepID=UPI001965E6C3|nr:SPOR domain-containing protein [Gordonia sp. PDNC005]QRY64443.1 SPOR domain-containing protein [Gordonia sp. PDNC005]
MSSGRQDWVLPAIIAVIVALLGVLGIVGWLILKDSSGTVAAPAAASSSLSAAPPTPATVTVTPPVTVTETHTPPPDAEPTSTESGAGGWYAQLGAFNDRSNAEAAAAEHGAVIRPGYVVGSSSTWVVVVPVASESEAESVCSGYGSGACYVRHSAE